VLLPIIDVHVHAMTADGAGTGAHGDPPFAFNLPTREWPAHDPAKAWAGVFFRWHEDAGGESTVWSPKTDDELRDQTLEVMERRNIIGVLCGPPDLVAAWRAAAPHRFIPAVGMAVGWTELTPESIRRLHAEGKLAVLAEVTNQYAGVEPDDDRFEPFLVVCEQPGRSEAGWRNRAEGRSLPPPGPVLLGGANAAAMAAMCPGSQHPRAECVAVPKAGFISRPAALLRSDDWVVCMPCRAPATASDDDRPARFGLIEGSRSRRPRLAVEQSAVR